MKLVRISSMWCTSCIVTKSDWDNIKENYEYEEYDYDMDEDKVKEFDVGKILPVIIVFKDDKEVLRIVGEKKKEEIEKMLGEL